MTNEEAIKQLEDLKFALSGTDDQTLDVIACDKAIEALRLIPDNATNREVFNKVFAASDLTEMVKIIDTFYGGKTVVLNEYWSKQLYDEWKEL